MANNRPNTVDTAINAAIKATGASKRLIQEACIAILIHAEKHGDWSKANTLVEGLPDSIRKDSLVQWFIKFGGLETSAANFVSWQGADYIRSNFQEAKETYWDDVKKPNNPWKGFNLDDEIKRLIDKANKELKAHRDSPDLKIDSEKLKSLAILVGQLNPAK